MKSLFVKHGYNSLLACEHVKKAKEIVESLQATLFWVGMMLSWLAVLSVGVFCLPYNERNGA